MSNISIRYNIEERTTAKNTVAYSSRRIPNESQFGTAVAKNNVRLIEARTRAKVARCRGWFNLAKEIE